MVTVVISLSFSILNNIFPLVFIFNFQCDMQYVHYIGGLAV